MRPLPTKSTTHSSSWSSSPPVGDVGSLAPDLRGVIPPALALPAPGCVSTLLKSVYAAEAASSFSQPDSAYPSSESSFDNGASSTRSNTVRRLGIRGVCCGSEVESAAAADDKGCGGAECGRREGRGGTGTVDGSMPGIERTRRWVGDELDRRRPPPLAWLSSDMRARPKDEDEPPELSIVRRFRARSDSAGALITLGGGGGACACACDEEDVLLRVGADGVEATWNNSPWICACARAARHTSDVTSRIFRSTSWRFAGALLRLGVAGVTVWSAGLNIDARLAVERRLIAAGVRVTDEAAFPLPFIPSLDAAAAAVEDGPVTREEAAGGTGVDIFVVLAAADAVALALEKYECRRLGVELPAPLLDAAADNSLRSCRLDLMGSAAAIGERSCAAMRRAFIQINRSSLHEAIISISYSPVFSLNELEGVAESREEFNLSISIQQLLYDDDDR